MSENEFFRAVNNGLTNFMEFMSGINSQNAFSTNWQININNLNSMALQRLLKGMCSDKDLLPVLIYYHWALLVLPWCQRNVNVNWVIGMFQKSMDLLEYCDFLKGSVF